MTGFTRWPGVLTLLLGAMTLGPVASDAGPRAAHPAEDPAFTTGPKAWALATTALLAYRNDECVDRLAPDAKDDSSVAHTRRVLRDWWSVDSRSDLVQTLEFLDQGGHRLKFQSMGQSLVSMTGGQYKALLSAQRDSPARARAIKLAREYYRMHGENSLVAWDYCRYIMLCRWGYLVGFLDEDEAWSRILPAARAIQRSFHSWGELGEDYLTGREFWSSEETGRTGWIYRGIQARLLKEPGSPWNRLPWETDLEASRTHDSKAPAGG